MLRVLSLGAGVQSSTVLLMSCVGELPKLDGAIFADTGWEPAAVYAHLAWLEAQAATAGIPVYRVSVGDLRAWAIAPRRSASGKAWDTLPHFSTGAKDGMAHRNCTERFKIAPIHAKLAELAGVLPKQRCREVRVTQWVGISLDEAHRMKPANRPWIQNHYPLVERRMRRADCLQWVESHGFPRPPRSACIGCPFHSDAEWREIRNDPAMWADAVAFEREVRIGQPRVFLHAQRVPLDQVDLSTAEERGQFSMFGNECAGVCGV